MNIIKFEDFADDLKEEILTYVGRNRDVYEKRWISMSRRNSIASWHWPACFVNIFWGAYRRMYIWVYVYFAMTTVVNLIPTDFVVTSIINAVDLGVDLAFTICANYIYLNRAVKKVAELRKSIPDRDERLGYLRRNEGYSLGSFWIFFAVFWAVVIISVFI
ncbi:DUF2628 domain-containing protein [Sporolactobacillus pectinivorans]|uniref:DUF2628 domain-containing protein n=1 Tax=Sporolactobacillus pectinivorans TaxID=1591408 RepID=UPI000C260286|nr:DUF2628 domain-containing protein [Sporolactobacillus pectinivorans]